MASIIKEANGRKTIQFVSPNGSGRPKVRLGKCSLRIAEKAKGFVEELVACIQTGLPRSPELTVWIESLNEELHDRLVHLKLLHEREVAMLRAWIERFIEQRTDVKPLTLCKYQTTRGYLIDFFGAERDLRTITPGDADEWRLNLMQRKVGEGTDLERFVSENTVRKHIAVAKVFFNGALRKRLIPSNPFEDQKATIQPNPSRFYFVSRSEIDLILDQCPDAEWRLIVALGRFGGLRCPSEHLALRWGDIDFERGRIHFRSPKTEHHPGGESRVIPLFPELIKPLQDVFDLAEPGTEYVITQHRDTNVNLRTQFSRIIERAGLKVWPRIFQNLRSTRQTELAESFPSHVVCEWMGNSEPVAAKHYLQITDEHFERAVQNAVQHLPEPPRNDTQQHLSRNAETQEIQQPAASCEAVLLCSVAEAGLEPARSVRNSGF
jgi:integrase